MAQYLEQYLSDDSEPDQQIIDFVVSGVVFLRKGDRSSDFFVIFRVKPVQFTSNWWFGEREGEWKIIDNQHTLYIVDGYYVLSDGFNG